MPPCPADTHIADKPSFYCPCQCWLCFSVYDVIRVHCILGVSQATVLGVHASIEGPLRGHSLLGVMNTAAKEAGPEDMQFRDVT